MIEFFIINFFEMIEYIIALMILAISGAFFGYIIALKVIESGK